MNESAKIQIIFISTYVRAKSTDLILGQMNFNMADDYLTRQKRFLKTSAVE